MPQTPATNNLLTCPVCEQPLDWQGRLCQCRAGHTFDVAKEGYLNLLLSHNRRSNSPGDTAEMVRARRSFLESDAYGDLSETINRMVIEILRAGPTPTTVNILDAGCGEGYFLGRLARKLRRTRMDSQAHLWGMDISKHAVRKASMHDREIHWVVANIMRKTPIAGRAVDIILSALAPRNAVEFARILKPTGAILVVVPGENHLIELRACLMAERGAFARKMEHALDTLAPMFELQTRTPLSFPLSLDQEQLKNLIGMTPMQWKASKPALAGVLKGEGGMQVTADFILATFHANA